jgi:capsular polysaccharide biosynthesis protein
LLGLLLGLAIVYLIERLDRRMKNVEELSSTSLSRGRLAR